MSEQLPVLVMSAPILNNSGYGRHATDIACSLLRYGKFDCKFAFQKWGACPPVNLEEEKKTNPYVDELLKRMLIGPLQAQPEVFCQVSIPNEFNPVGKFNFGITAGIESTVPSGPFVEGLNRMNMNIVPSNFNKNVFSNVVLSKQNQDGSKSEIKMNKPMEVVFEGCNLNVFKKVSGSNSLDSFMETITEDFVYLFTGHWIQGDFGHDRKDIGTLIKVFCEVFKNKKKRPALLLKTSSATTCIMDRHDLINRINQIKGMVQGDLPNIYLLHGELSDTEMNDLYNHPKIKSMVTFTHGESWGRPLLEFSMTGKPIIASGWSGQVDFLNKDYSVLLPGTLQNIHQSAANDWLLKEAQWFYVNQSIAARSLDVVYNDYPKYLDKCSKLASENASKFSIEAFDKAFWAVLDKYIPEFPKQQQMILPKLKFKK